MNHIQFLKNPNVLLLIKQDHLIKDEIIKYYPFVNKIPTLAISLAYPNKKVSLTFARDYLKKLLPYVDKNISTIFVADATYFKALTKKTKTAGAIGYVYDCAIDGFKHLKVVYGINYAQLLYNPNMLSSLNITCDTLINAVQNKPTPLEKNSTIIKSAYYPKTDNEIQQALNNLLNQKNLTCDIETFGLQIGKGIASIAFSLNLHTGIAFLVNKNTLPMLKQFFINYNGNLIFHNASFDIKHIIYECFMTHDKDYKGMLYGLDVMCKNMHDTKIIAYLATNSTAKESLSLKSLSHEFAGNYAVNTKDIAKLSTNDLLQYNLMDSICTYYVYKKYLPIMQKDSQEPIYKNLMLPSLKTIIYMELFGMPIDINNVHKIDNDLSQKQNIYLHKILNHSTVKLTQEYLKNCAIDKYKSKRKTKPTKEQIKKAVGNIIFNPNSSQHLSALLYEVLKLPVLSYTLGKAPATSADVIEKLIKHTKNNDYKSLLNCLLEYNKITKILTTYIPTFKNAVKKQDGFYYLHGNFNLGGTMSGRLSSSNPNLQNIPSGSTYGKLIKTCFCAPKGYLMVGADFSSLEDRINALLTKDENKLKVYTDGYDGHSLRAYYYWKDEMPDINLSVESINSIKDKYPAYRQKSKAPTFALTYSGTYKTLMTNCDFSEEEAKKIETNYHKLYKQSDKYLKDKLNICQTQGYIDVAFGLRIRTPILARTLLNSPNAPKQVQAEARSVGNAISGQSYSLLTNRAINAFMQKVYNSAYRYEIFPISLIHDAIYLCIKDDVKIVKWVNDELIKQMRWQKLEQIQHEKVHLEAQLDIYYPNWANPITLPNGISIEEIKTICKNASKN